MNKGKANMKENEEKQKNASSCFEGQAWAEMMQKILGDRRIGSLCEEMMRSMMKKCREAKEGPHDTGKKNKETGGVK